MNKQALEQWGRDQKLGDAPKNLEWGAATSVWAAVAKSLQGRGGLYLEDCQILEPAGPDPKEYEPGHGAHTYDEKDRGRGRAATVGEVWRATEVSYSQYLVQD